jgi:hypothetical protein
MDDVTFYTWATPLIMHMVKHGEVKRAPLNPDLLETFYAVLERMRATPFHQLLSGLEPKWQDCIATWLEKNSTRATFEKVASKWPDTVTRALPSNSSDQSGPGSGSWFHDFRPRQTYFTPAVQAQLREVEARETMEDFLKLTIGDAQCPAPDQVQDQDLDGMDLDG